MAKKDKEASQEKEMSVEDFTSNLIDALNKERDSLVAYNLSTDVAPTLIKRWIGTGSTQLDYIISNRAKGGIPEGRVIEVFGPPAIGKSHLAIQIAKACQAMGGIVVYIDTENATDVNNLQALGVDITNRFAYVEVGCTEEVFEIAESTIKKIQLLKKDVPTVIIWDSIAASCPKAELEGEYTDKQVGEQARAISKGMRKIVQVLGNSHATFVCLNQTRAKIGGYIVGDPDTPSGGRAVPFHASVRLKLSAGSHIKDEKGNVLGIHVTAKTIKNKLTFPFRAVDFDIMFGQGIVEHEYIFDWLREHGEEIIDGHKVKVEGAQAWKTFTVIDAKTGVVAVDKKFYKSDFGTVMCDPKCKPWINKLLDRAYVMKPSIKHVKIDAESRVEVEAVKDMLTEGGK